MDNLTVINKVAKNTNYKLVEATTSARVQDILNEMIWTLQAKVKATNLLNLPVFKGTIAGDSSLTLGTLLSDIFAGSDNSDIIKKFVNAFWDQIDDGTIDSAAQGVQDCWNYLLAVLTVGRLLVVWEHSGHLVSFKSPHYDFFGGHFVFFDHIRIKDKSGKIQDFDLNIPCEYNFSSWTDYYIEVYSYTNDDREHSNGYIKLKDFKKDPVEFYEAWPDIVSLL